MKIQDDNIHYYTSKDIYEGEELFIDYGVGYWEYIKKHTLETDNSNSFCNNTT